MIRRPLDAPQQPWVGRRERAPLCLGRSRCRGQHASTVTGDQPSVKTILPMTFITITDMLHGWPMRSSSHSSTPSLPSPARGASAPLRSSSSSASRPSPRASRTLERSFGAPLLARSRTGSRLTDVGRALLPHAERTLSAVAAGRRAVEDVVSGSGGRLTIGAAPAVSTYVLPAMLHRFQADHPRVQLSVRSGHSEEVLEMVLREEVEIGLMRPIQHRRRREHAALRG